MADFGCAELLDEACHRKGFPENKDAGTLWYNPPDVSGIQFIRTRHRGTSNTRVLFAEICYIRRLGISTGKMQMSYTEKCHFSEWLLRVDRATAFL